MPDDGSNLRLNSPIIVEQEDVMQAMSTETFIGNKGGPVIRPVDADCSELPLCPGTL